MRLLTKGEMHEYMTYCIELAKQAEGIIPRPHVGAVVLAEDGEIIGEGYKSFIDGTKFTIHAEKMAIENTEDSDKKPFHLITTLEPCIRKSKNQLFSSSCELIVERGIKNVIFGLNDNSATVYNGKGMRFLRKNGIDVFNYEGLSSQIEEELMGRLLV